MRAIWLRFGKTAGFTKRSKPVAILRSYCLPLMTAERKNAIQHAIDLMANGLSWGGTLKRFKRGEMHES
jgi:hypothetical protein